MAEDSVFAPKYEHSWGLVIGINKYTKASPLMYAANDANAVAEYLRDRLAFPKANLKVLIDGNATRDEIMSAFLRLADTTSPDDRLVVFFAGHGHTRTARRGEIGYLVPSDGDPADLSTLIRWDDLTKNAELIPAKHIIFIMDACYGGLALTRTVPTNSLRFLKDMLSRYSRQVLTAGKADEVVADAGGPRPQHSIFTGHLLDALEGSAKSTDGTITANAVMAYVYERVAKDLGSRQSPHYGFRDGDGDFVFEAPQLSALLKDDKRDQDVLIEPVLPQQPVQPAAAREVFANTVKEYLSDTRYRIKLDDIVGTELRSLHQSVSGDAFPMTTPAVTADQIAERLRSYERAVDRFACLLLLLARWGGEEHRAILARAATRLVENNELSGGQTIWLGLRWYPADLTLYASGIAALSADNYTNIATLFLSRVAPRLSGEPQATLLEAVVDGMLDATRVDAFKVLPGHERQYTPRSEYLFKTVQPLVEDLLYVGRMYEELFDRYEILAALVYADLRNERGRTNLWGPPGRFAWKISRGIGDDPYSRVIAEAARLKEEWPPLKAGLFGGSYTRFNQVADPYRALIGKMGWH